MRHLRQGRQYGVSVAAVSESGEESEEIYGDFATGKKLFVNAERFIQVAYSCL